MSRSAGVIPIPDQSVKQDDKSLKDGNKSVKKDNKQHKKEDSLASKVKLKPFMSLPVVTEKSGENNLPNEPVQENNKVKPNQEDHDPKKEDNHLKKKDDKPKMKDNKPKKNGEEPKMKDDQAKKKYGLFLDTVSETPEEEKMASGEKKS